MDLRRLPGLFSAHGPGGSYGFIPVAWQSRSALLWSYGFSDLGDLIEKKLELPLPLTIRRIAGGYRLLDSSQRALLVAYCRDPAHEARIAGVITFEEGRGGSALP